MEFSFVSFSCLAACGLIAVATAFGQAVPGAEGDVFVLEPFAVGPHGVPTGAGLSVPDRLGDGDGPRSLTTIDSALGDLGLTEMDQISAVAPGVYAPARFGNVTVPDIRGDAAESFLNGQRRGGNLLGYQPVFNSVEAVEILRGGGTVVTGAGKRTGGAVNFVTKTPDLDRRSTRLSVDLGNWLPEGGTYPALRWQIDRNLPLGPRSALRLSYEGQENDTFIENGRDDHQSLFLAWRRLTASGGTWDLRGEALWQAAPQLMGVNRPSQELIDHGRYVTGVPDPSLPLTSGFPVGPGEPGLLDPTATDRVRLPRDASLLSDGDSSNAHVYWLQSAWRQPLNLVPQVELVLLNLAERVDRRRFHESFYAEDVRQTTLDNRLELHYDWLTGLIRRGVVGVGARYEGRRNFANYWNEFGYAFDLSAPGHDRSASRAIPYAVIPGRPGPEGVPYFSPADGLLATPETVASRLGQFAAYVDQEFQLAPRWNLRVGGRWDTFVADAEDPLPPPDTARLRADESVSNFGHSLSLTYTPTDRGQLYLTRTRLAGAAGNTVGDGLNLYAVGDRAFIREEELRNETRLWELGWRWAPAAWFDSHLAAFLQHRARQEFFFNSALEAKGGEWEFSVRRPGEAWRFFGGVAYLDARYDDSAPAEFGGSSLGHVYAPGTGPAGLGTGLGYLGGFFLGSLPAGDYRLPGVSRWTVNGGFTVPVVPSLEATLYGRWQSPQPGNLRREYHLPAQFELNLTLHWSRGSWHVFADVLNLTDEENWIHNGDTFFDNLLLSRNEPRRLRLRVQWEY